MLRNKDRGKGCNFNSVDRKDLLDKVGGKQLFEGSEGVGQAEILGTDRKEW